MLRTRVDHSASETVDDLLYMARSQIRFSSDTPFVQAETSGTTITSARRRQAALNLTRQSQELEHPGRRGWLARYGLTAAALTSLAALLAILASQLGG